jgi:hypothetical protein
MPKDGAKLPDDSISALDRVGVKWGCRGRTENKPPPEKKMARTLGFMPA